MENVIEIKEGNVKYQGRDDIKCRYCNDASGVQKFITETLPNGYMVVTGNLKSAVDSYFASMSANDFGVMNEYGNMVIPGIYRSIRQINDNLLLLEIAEPVSDSVKGAIEARREPSRYTELVKSQSDIRNKFKTKFGNDVRYLFNNHFSEATVSDINGNNVLNNEYYSYIVLDNDKLFLCKNSQDSEIVEYSLVPSEVQKEEQVVEQQPIDVSAVQVDQNTVEDALASAAPSENVNVGFAQEDVAPVALNDEQMVTEPTDTQAVTEVQPIAPQEESNQETESNEMISIPTIKADEELPIEGSNGEAVETPLDEVIAAQEEVVSEEPVEEVTTNQGEVASGEPVEEVTTNQEEVASEEPVEEVTTNQEEVVSEEPVEEVENAEDIDLEVSDEKEDTKLDDMFHEVEDARDVEKDMTEDIFSESSIKTDSISYEDEFEDNSYEDISTVKDTTMEDVAKSMAALIKQNKELKATNNELSNKLESANNSKNNVIKKNRMLEEKIDILSSKNQSLDNKVIKLESKTDILENRVHDQERVIDSQGREIDNLRGQLAGKDKIDELLKAADEVLENDNDLRDISYYRRIA